jgi:hypothetical protein
MFLVAHNHALGSGLAFDDVALHPTIWNVHFLVTTIGMLLFSLFLQESRVKRGRDGQLWVVWLDNVEWVTSQLTAAFQSVKWITIPLTVADWPPWSIRALFSHDTAAMSILTMSYLPLTVDAN